MSMNSYLCEVWVYLQALRPLDRTTLQSRPVGFRPMTPITLSLTYCLKNKQTKKKYKNPHWLCFIESLQNTACLCFCYTSFQILSSNVRRTMGFWFSVLAAKVTADRLLCIPNKINCLIKSNGHLLYMNVLYFPI